MICIRWCNGFRSSVVKWFAFGAVMVSALRWCNFVFLDDVMVGVPR